MSRQLSEQEILEAVKNETLIIGGSTNSVEGLKYDFRLGDEILFGGESESRQHSLVLKPGELIFALTKEEIQLPGDVKAELSLKRKMSIAGVLVLGGFGIDPGYKGKLLFALFNFSPDPFVLEPGKKLIAAQFYRLEGKEVPPQREKI